MEKIKFFNKNQHGRDFVVGDIHGHFSLLLRQLKSINFNYEIDRLFALGDLIDRGPESDKCLEFLNKDWFFSIKGNHEVIAYEYYMSEGKEWERYPEFGGQWFIDLPRFKQKEYASELNKLPNVFEIEVPYGKVGIVHAQCISDDWEKFKNNFSEFENSSLWNYERYNISTHYGIDKPIKNINYIFNGHIPLKTAYNTMNTYYIDTGKYAKKLTIVEINQQDGKLIFH